MFKLKERFESKEYEFNYVIASMLGVMLLALIVGLVVINMTKVSTTTTKKVAPKVIATTGNPMAILPPATVASKVNECSETITYGTSGAPTPLQCSNGNLNVTAWEAISALEPKVMALGYTASQADVQAAMCSDANAADADSSASLSTALETSAYTMSALYYGWSFGTAPIAVLTNGSC